MSKLRNRPESTAMSVSLARVTARCRPGGPFASGSAAWHLWRCRKQRALEACGVLGAVLNAAGGKSNTNPSPASREAGRKDPMSAGGEAHGQSLALLPPPRCGHGGKATATVAPHRYALVLPASLVPDLSVLENVIDSLAPAAGLPARKGRGARRSPGARAISVILRRVQTASPFNPSP